MDWIELAHQRPQRRTSVKMVMNLRSQKSAGPEATLSKCRTADFHKKSQTWPRHDKFSLRSEIRHADSARNLLYIIMAAVVLCPAHWLNEDMKCRIWTHLSIPCFGFHKAGHSLSSRVLKVLRKTYAIQWVKYVRSLEKWRPA